MATYSPSCRSNPHPKRDVVKKIRPNTPYGASFIARSMILTIASPTASSTRTSGRARSSGIRVSAAPKTSEKKITPSRSIPAAAWMGFRGTMLTNVSMPKCVVPAACNPCACAR